jgi:dTDP-4-dehydrorhamnose reductase
LLRAQRPVKGRWLIVGGDGLIGLALAGHCSTLIHGAQDTLSTTRQRDHAGPNRIYFDLAHPDHQWPAFPTVDAAIICAGITSLDQCRREPAATRYVNVTQTVQLAHRLAKCAGLVMFFSTNLVFDGTQPQRPPDDPPCPCTEYGRQKAEVESALRSDPEKFAVIRLTKVMHPRFTLVNSWQTNLSKGHRIQAFSDLKCAPIGLDLVLKAVTAIAANQIGGIWQLSAAADVSYADIARQIAQRMGAPSDLVESVSSTTARGLEHVPMHTTLDVERVETELGIRMPDPHDVIDRTFFP